MVLAGITAIFEAMVAVMSLARAMMWKARMVDAIGRSPALPLIKVGNTLFGCPH